MGIFLLLNACIALFPCFCGTMWRWTVLSYYMGCRNRFNSSPAQEEISSKFSSGHLQRPNVTGFSEMKKKKNPVASLGKKKVRRQGGTDSLPYMHFLYGVLNKTRITFTIQSKSAFNPSSPKPTCNARLSLTRNKKISWTWAAICSIANWRHTDVKAALWCRQHMCHIYLFSVNAKKANTASGLAKYPQRTTKCLPFAWWMVVLDVWLYQLKTTFHLQPQTCNFPFINRNPS